MKANPVLSHTITKNYHKKNKKNHSITRNNRLTVQSLRCGSGVRRDKTLSHKTRETQANKAQVETKGN